MKTIKCQPDITMIQLTSPNDNTTTTNYSQQCTKRHEEHQSNNGDVMQTVEVMELQSVHSDEQRHKIPSNQMKQWTRLHNENQCNLKSRTTTTTQLQIPKYNKHFTKSETIIKQQHVQVEMTNVSVEVVEAYRSQPENPRIKIDYDQVRVLNRVFQVNWKSQK